MRHSRRAIAALLLASPRACDACPVCPDGYINPNPSDCKNWACGTGCPGGTWATHQCGCSCQCVTGYPVQWIEQDASGSYTIPHTEPCTEKPRPPPPPAAPPPPPHPPGKAPKPPPPSPPPLEYSGCELRVTAVASGESFQLSEVKFFSGSGADTLLSVSSVTSTAWYHTDDGGAGSQYSDQSPSKLIDENTGTKLCCGGPPLDIAFTFSADSQVASYDLWTADDTPDRDPTSWSRHCAIGGQRRELDSHTDFDVSGLGRKTAYGLPNLVSPPPPAPPPAPPAPPALPAPPAPPFGGMCPETHPYAYRPDKNLDYCCASADGRRIGEEGKNALPNLSARSDTCKDSAYEACPQPPCSDFSPSPLAVCLAVCASYTRKCHGAEVGCGGCDSYNCGISCCDGM